MGAYAAWILPASLGAILNWSLWIVLAAFIPGLVMYAASEGVRCYEEVLVTSPDAPVGRRLPVLYGLPLFATVIIFPSRFSGLLIVLGFLLVDIGSWLRRKKDRRQEVAQARDMMR
jgi:hypothetical protein